MRPFDSADCWVVTQFHAWPFVFVRLFQRSMLHGKAYSGRVRGWVGVGAVQGIRDFPYLKLGIRDFKVKQERDSGLKVCTGGVMPKKTLGITGLHEIMGQDYKIKEPHWGLCAAKAKITHFSLTGRNHKKKHALFKTLNSENVYPVLTQDSENHTLLSGAYLFRECPRLPPGMFTSVSSASSCSAIDSKRLSVWIITAIL